MRRERHAPKQKATVAELELAGPLGVVDQRHRKHGRGSEAQRVPLLRARDDERLVLQEPSQQFLGRRRHRTEATRLWMDVEPRRERPKDRIAHEAVRQARRVCTPARELARAVHAPRLQLRRSSGGHCMNFPEKNIHHRPIYARAP
jgi:hypothetical protein